MDILDRVIDYSTTLQHHVESLGEDHPIFQALKPFLPKPSKDWDAAWLKAHLLFVRETRRVINTTDVSTIADDLVWMCMCDDLLIPSELFTVELEQLNQYVDNHVLQLLN